MLLTLNARSLQSRLQAKGRNRLEVTEIPRHTMERLSLRGLVIDTDLLKGWSLDQLDSLRITADQAACPFLVLRESQPVDVTGGATKSAEQLLARLDLVARAGHRLGCNAVAILPIGVSTDANLAAAAQFLRGVMDQVDRMEMNLLLEPGRDRLSTPEGLIEVIKKVGGFRIGTMPNFAAAIESGDCASFLRQTAPYASAVLATCPALTSGKLPAKDRKRLDQCVESLRSVGYEQMLAIDYVGGGEPDAAIDAARDEISAVLQEE